MELIRGLHNIRAAHRGCVATVGKFDGIHLGHQAVLQQLMRLSAEIGVPTLVTVFEPQPNEYFQGHSAPARLTRFREKFDLVEQAGIDRMLCVTFDDALALLSAKAFIEKLLVDGVGVKALVSGKDFRFGRGREGNLDLLEVTAEGYGFQVLPAETFMLDGSQVSSTRVRASLTCGDLNETRRLLGRHYSISGRVVRGDQRDRSKGFPTANVRLNRLVSPLQGIFAVRVHGIDDGTRERVYDGVAFVATRRSFITGETPLLEVFVLDFDADLYQQFIRVEFIAKLRDDMVFSTGEALGAQVSQDVENARRVLDQ
jgi:riboflavin kinase/FMN adenylyltransferase